MKKYAAYKEFQKFKGKLYPVGSEFENRDGQIYNEDGFMCLAASEKAKETLVGNDDGMWKKRGELVNEIRELIKITGDKPVDKILAVYDWLFSDKTVYQYGKNHNPDTDAWIWNADFFAASIEDLEYIKKEVEDRLK